MLSMPKRGCRRFCSIAPLAASAAWQHHGGERSSVWAAVWAAAPAVATAGAAAAIVASTAAWVIRGRREEEPQSLATKIYDALDEVLMLPFELAIVVM